MPEAINYKVPWVYDYVEHYDLDADLIERFLRGIWGNYKFFVEASLMIDSIFIIYPAY